MLAVSALIENGLKKNGKPILISGATGGVGSIAILILSKLGFSVSALTSKSNQKTYLKKIGAEEVISIKSFSNYPDMPLLKTKFSSIIDNIGGNVISIGSRQLENNGNIASVGIASSETSNINIMPLILRGIKIVGINAENTPYLIRKKIWKKISALSKDNRLNYIYNECKFKDIAKKIRKIGLNKNFGRTIIKIKK